MNKEILKQVIKESQEFKFPEIIPRELQIPLKSQKIVAITGSRRSGKTFLIYSLIKKLASQGVSPERIIYINFDDPRLLPSDAQTLESILESYCELYPEYRKKKNFIFLDEIQNVENWEIGIRRIYDTRNFYLFLTGSSSKLLSQEISTRLRGRAINFEVLPFSFKEILSAKEIPLYKNIFYSQERFAVIKQLEAYLEMGGFPEVVLEESKDLKIRTLQEYLETMFFRDLIERFKVKNQPVIRELIKYLSMNTASLFSLNAFFKWIKQSYPITKRTLINYVSALEDIGLFFLVKKFSFSLKEQSLTPRKSYIVDNGFRTAYGFRFSEDKGKILENTVFLELRHRQAKNPLMQIYYWQDYKKREVDFVVMHGGKTETLIQVCSDIHDFKAKEREITSLIKASQELKCKNLLVLNPDQEKEEKLDKKKIIIKPLWKWLITNPD
jgi:predicted AAA+ superfamily ATPase